MAHYNLPKNKIAILLIVFISIFNAVVRAQSVIPDPSYGNNGLLFFYSYDTTNNAYLSKIVDAPNGDIYLVYGGSFFRTFVVKYFRNGQLDSSFGINGRTSTVSVQFEQAAIDSAGRFLIAGEAQGIDGRYDMAVLRFNVNGQNDQTFRFTGGSYIFCTSCFDFVDSLEIVGDKVVITGHTDSYNAGFTYYYYLLNSNGGIIRTYSDNIPLQPISVFNWGDKYLVKQDNTATGTIITRYNKDNTIDNGFGIGGVLSVAGKPVIHNDQLYILNADSLYRYRYDGILDVGFNGTGSQVVTGNKLVFLPGKIYVHGKGFLIRLNEDGSYDKSFNGTGSLFPVDEKLLFRDDKIYIYHGLGIFRLNNDGSYDKSFNGSGRAAVGADELVFQNESMFAIAHQNIAKLNLNGKLDTSFSISGFYTTKDLGELHRLIVDGNRILLRGIYLPANVEAAAAYTFNPQPAFSCKPDIEVATDPDKCTAVVKNIDPVLNGEGDYSGIRYTLSGATTGTGTGSASNKVFSKGITIVTYTIAANPSATCSFLVVVRDRQNPVIAAAFAFPSMLWPPNHKMVDVEVSYQLTDNCGASSTLMITSNEPDYGIDKDDIANDWQVIDAHHVRLRAERNSLGTGRVYTITISAVDQAGKKAIQNLYVAVPHDASGPTKFKNELSVKVAPNPAIGYFTIFTESKDQQKIAIRITDIYGRIIETRSNLSPNTTVQLGHAWKPGLYYAECTQGDQKLVIKLVKAAGNNIGN